MNRLGSSDPRRSLKMAELYEQGLTLSEIGDRHGVTRERVRQVLEAMGVSRRDRQGQGRRRDEDKLARIIELHSKGWTWAAIAEELGILRMKTVPRQMWIRARARGQLVQIDPEYQLGEVLGAMAKAKPCAPSVACG